MAEILGDDEIGIELQEQFRIETINTFMAPDEFAHLAIDFGGNRGYINPRANERGLGCRFRGEIALMCDADYGITRADGVEDFGRGRKKGNNAHGSGSLALHSMQHKAKRCGVKAAKGRRFR